MIHDSSSTHIHIHDKAGLENNKNAILSKLNYGNI